ncbi:hypothetical protein ACROYT_G022885 [Oculina patagonica]
MNRSNSMRFGICHRKLRKVSPSSDFTMATAKGNLKVTLAIFSDCPDPEWQVLTCDPSYKEIERLLDIARFGGFIYHHKDMPARLGYKGFLIHHTARKNSQPKLISGPHTVQLQQLLLKTVPDDIFSEELCYDISKEIDEKAATGSLSVILSIFSGRPDPVWQVLSGDPNYKNILRLLGTARSGGFIYHCRDMPSRLGYRGFLVHDSTNGKAELEFVFGPYTVQLQQLLVKTIPDDIFSEETRNNISKEIDTEYATYNPLPLDCKGFLVQATKKSAEPGLIIRPHTVELQQLLLKTVPHGMLSEALCKRISEGIDTEAGTANAKGGM